MSDRGVPASADDGAPATDSSVNSAVVLPRAPRQRDRVEIYDTTLRDGTQLEGISVTVDDKLRIAEQLDWLGVKYIEAGWPGANPKDDELFKRAPAEIGGVMSTPLRATKMFSPVHSLTSPARLSMIASS